MPLSIGLGPSLARSDSKHYVPQELSGLILDDAGTDSRATVDDDGTDKHVQVGPGD